MPTGLIRILDRDLKAAGIPKRDERGRTIDVHAMRHTFGTLLSKGGVAPRTAQAAMRHSSINLTMNTYTDPKLLDVQGAMESLPALPLGAEQQNTTEYLTATGTDDSSPSQFAPAFAPDTGYRGQTVSSGGTFDVDTTGESVLPSVALTADADNGKDPLTTPVNESLEWAMRDSNPRHPRCKRASGQSEVAEDKELTQSPSPVCTSVCTSNSKSDHICPSDDESDDPLEAIVAAVSQLPPEQLARLVERLVPQPE